MNEHQDTLIKTAMTYGLALGIFWMIKFIFFILGASNPLFIKIFTILTIAVPFLAYYFTKKYRDEKLGGQISFFHAWRFGMMLYFFAALVVSLEHFVLFQYVVSHDFYERLMNLLINMMQQSQMDASTLQSIAKQTIPSPIHIAVQNIFNNMFYGILLSIPVALLLRRNKQTAGKTEE